MDRSIGPKISEEITIKIPKAEKVNLNNNIQLYLLPNPNLEVFRLEIVYDAGSVFGEKYADAYFLSKMLTAGTEKLTAAQIAEKLDNFGGFLEVNQNYERLQIVLHGLQVHFDKYLTTLKSLIYESTIPEEELTIQKNISKQTYLVNNEKTAFVASSVIKKALFGNEHPFGKSMNAEEIDAIDKNGLTKFYNDFILKSPFKIFLSGKFDQEQIKQLNETFGQAPILSTERTFGLPSLQAPQYQKIEKEGSLQSSIRIGKVTFNRNHPDFYGFMVMSTLLGGYFGSRLMKNIREEKGLTYGISSQQVPLAGTGYFLIGTDVNKENVAVAIEEIQKEIDILKNTNVDADELSIVKNYMSGSILGGTNTVFDLMDKQKAIIYEGLPLDFYDNLIPEIRKVDAEQIKQIANTYLKDLTTVVVG